MSEQKQLERLLKKAMERPGVEDVMRIYAQNKAVIDKVQPYVTYQSAKRPRYYTDKDSH